MQKISAIICTHNPRENYLRRVLDALRVQTLPPAQWELLLIDNASQMLLSERFDISWHPQARHIREDEIGLTPARLRGIREAKAEILVFVDDDTVLAPDYLEQALAVGTEWPFVGAWGGRSIPEYEQPLPEWVGSEVWRLTVADVNEDVWSNLREDWGNFPVGAGLCVRHQVALKYLERCQSNSASITLDRSGKGLGGYGDIDLVFCAMDLGLGKGKSARLSLTHLIPSGRLTLEYFTRHAESDAASMMVFRASRGMLIQKPKPPTWLWRTRWLLHRIKNRVSREQYEIQKAALRGQKIGWNAVQSSLNQANTHKKS